MSEPPISPPPGGARPVRRAHPGDMLLQAAGLAILAALSPTTLFITTVYLGSMRPRSATAWYLVAAIVSCLVWGTVLLVVLRSGHLQYRAERTPRYGLRTALGLLMLATAAVIVVRGPRAPQEGKTGGRLVRLAYQPSVPSALLAGAAMFLPSLTFIAAVQVIGTAGAGKGLSALGLLIVAGITAVPVWLPFVAYLATGDRAVSGFRSVNAFLTAHGRYVLIGALCVGGVFLTVNGLTGLAGLQLAPAREALGLRSRSQSAIAGPRGNCGNSAFQTSRRQSDLPCAKKTKGETFLGGEEVPGVI